MFGKAKVFLPKSDFRKIADEIYKKFPFFYIDEQEFRDRCLLLQRCGAGIVLGHPFENFDVRIIVINENYQKIFYENLPLGHFGEIVFKKFDDDNFTHTGYYGFFDQQARMWCCGKIKDTAILDGKKYFPFCIEPLFERIWWAEAAKLSTKAKTACSDIVLHIDLLPKKIFCPIIRIFPTFFKRRLEKFSKKFKISSQIKSFGIIFKQQQLLASD